jgi:hypothetical protein
MWRDELSPSSPLYSSRLLIQYGLPSRNAEVLFHLNERLRVELHEPPREEESKWVGLGRLLAV